MATGDTAASMPVSSPPPPLDRTPSNMSSPLSEVEDKDGEPDDMDLDLENHHSPASGRSSHGDGDDDTSRAQRAPTSASDDDGDSNLSELETNDSEAETERLEDTPRKKRTTREPFDGAAADERKHFIQSRDRAFEPSPSKLKQQIGVDVAQLQNREDNEEEDEEDEELSELEAGDESDVSSQPETTHTGNSSAQERGRPGEVQPQHGAEISSGALSETRKRKRSVVADQSESEQPLRKRVGSVGVDRETTNDKLPVDDDTENISTNPHSGDHSAEEDEANDQDEHIAESIESAGADAGRPRKSRRNGIKRRKDLDDNGNASEPHEDGLDEDNSVAREDAAARGEDEQGEGGIDEEAEIAHKNEEELERKRAAFDQLHAIEKHFSTFRERLYQERLAQLTEEEAMLTGDNPTHPEYLAMLQCIEARLDEKQRIINLEYEFNMDTTKRWAVARRSQIHSQYFQSVRQSRERVLEDLGRQWYHIQQQRRRHANTIPDFSIRFPASKPQRVKNAVAYNKEVSILAGVAKHEGFPAAPHIHGASTGEVDEDLEEILRSRQSSQQQPGVQPSFQDLSGLTFYLGAAGQQYLTDTPWANPNHPSHQAQRQEPTQELHTIGPATAQTNRRHSHEPGGLFSSSTNSTIAAGNAINGDSPAAKARVVTGAELSKPTKAMPGQTLKREHLV